MTLIPSYIPPLISNAPPQRVDEGYYANFLFDPDDTQPNFVGLHLNSTAPTSDPNWKIFAFTYDISGGITQIQMGYSTWDARASLF